MLNFKVNRMFDFEELFMKFVNISDERSVINVVN